MREKRNEAIQALPDLSAYSLLRVDLMNMGGINDQVGKDVTDQILKHISEGIAAQCDQAGVTYELFPIGGGVYDVVIKSQDQELIDSLKQDIFYKLRREIFDQTVEGYCKAHDLPFMPGADSVRLRDLDDIRGGRQGAGVVITDINLDNSYALESIEARIDLLKLHGIATITQSRNDLSVQRSPLAGIRKIFESWSRKAEETTEEKRAFQILNVTGVQEREVVDDIDPDQDNVFPYARSLRSRLSQQQIENVFAQGSVAVYQTLMGVSMSRGEATDIAHQQNRDTGRKRFKKINGVCEALQGIALIQKYNEAHENDTAFIRLEDSIDYLQKDVDFLRTVNRNMEDGRQIEAISQLANACVHAANITGVSVPPRINHIVASLSYKALLDVADFTRDTGDEHISEVIVNFANTLDEKAGGDISAEGGYFAIFRELERQRMLIEESTALTEDQRQAILSQLSYAEDRSQDGDGLTYYAREELEMMAERHKVWLETEGQKGACLILNKLRIKGAAFMHDFNRAMRGQNAELFYDFTGAELRDSRTTKLDYGNARFKDAIVDNMDFDCSMMDNADFRDVKELRRSSFAFCGIQGTKFTLSEGFLTCRFYSGGIKHGDYSEFDGLEIYMPDGRRVAGFYPDGWGYMHFSPTKRDEQKNAGQNVTADEVKVFVAAAAAAQQENAVSADRDGRKEKPQI